MIRHILLFSFHADTSAEAARSMLEEFARFPMRFSQMRDWELGRNDSSRDDTFDYAMTVKFEDRAALHAYLDSAEHERFVTERFRPLIKQRAIATFEVLPDFP
jgi:2,3-dihydroxy-p-cumate/2,3-dihydroxybenzoate 3,4-dioxygenase